MNLCGLRNIVHRQLMSISFPTTSRRLSRTSWNRVNTKPVTFWTTWMCKTTVPQKLCNELGVDVYVINGSDEGDSLSTVRNNEELRLRPSRFSSATNTKSSSLTKQITHQTTFNSPYGHLLRSLLATVASSSPVTTKQIIQPLHSRCGSWILLSAEKTNSPSPKFFERIQEILTEERVSFEPKVLATADSKTFP